MKPLSVRLGTLFLLFFSSSVGFAQERSVQVALRAGAYDAKHETTLAGVVSKFTEVSALAPAGAHLTLQTSQGAAVDVHLGSSAYLKENHFSVKTGDSIRVSGATVSTNSGPVFLARAIQEGGQTLVIRSVRGFPLAGYTARQSLRSRDRQVVPEVKPQ